MKQAANVVLTDALPNAHRSLRDIAKERNSRIHTDPLHDGYWSLRDTENQYDSQTIQTTSLSDGYELFRDISRQHVVKTVQPTMPLTHTLKLPQATHTATLFDKQPSTAMLVSPSKQILHERTVDSNYPVNGYIEQSEDFLGQSSFLHEEEELSVTYQRKITKQDTQPIEMLTTNALAPRLVVIEDALVEMQQTIQTLVRKNQSDAPDMQHMLREANEERLVVAHRYIEQMYWFYIFLVVMATILGFLVPFLFPNGLLVADVLIVSGIFGNVIGGFAGVQQVRGSAHVRLQVNEGPQAHLFKVELDRIMARSRKLLLSLVLSVPVAVIMGVLSVWFSSLHSIPYQNLVVASCTAVTSALLAFTAGSVNYGARLGPLVALLLQPIQKVPLQERVVDEASFIKEN